MKCYTCESYLYPSLKRDKDRCSFFEMNLENLDTGDCEWYSPDRETLVANIIDLEKENAKLKELLECHVQDTRCDFDDDGCQQHGFYSLEQGEKCPTFEAQQFLNIEVI